MARRRRPFLDGQQRFGAFAPDGDFRRSFRELYLTFSASLRANRTLNIKRLRQYITSNRTFGHLGAYYGLRAALVWGPGYLEGKRWDNEVRNTADTFEAVLGGIIRGDENNPGDFEAASRFVFALITPAVFPELAVIKKYLEEPSPWVGAEKGKRSGRVEDLLENVELFHPLASQDAPPEDTIGHCWRDQKLPGSDWTTRFYVNGREVATGIGIRRETAREAALTAYVEKMENMA
ncbi:hypothetical protein JCM11641_002411 [Rhodosporidiobolus odoratus]